MEPGHRARIDRVAVAVIGPLSPPVIAHGAGCGDGSGRPTRAPAMARPEFAVSGHTSCDLTTKSLTGRGHSRRVRCRGGHVVHVGVRIAAQAAGITGF